jgi:hypothetical protein
MSKLRVCEVGQEAFIEEMKNAYMKTGNVRGRCNLGI